MAKNQPAFGYLYISPGVTGEYCKLLEKNTLFGPPLVNCELPEVPLFDGTILTQNATNYVTDNNIYDASVHFQTGGNVSQYSLQGNPSWLQIVSSTGVLFGTPDASGDTAGITVVGANAAGSAVSNPFTMSVAVNPPIFTGTIPNYQFEEGLTIPPADMSGYFQAGGPVLTYSLQNAPAWLNIDPATGIVSGTPNTGDDYTNVTVSGTNGDGTAVSNTFDINVTDILPAPEFTGSIPNITGYIGFPIEAYDASVDFSGQVGSYSLIGNPAWLQINPSTGLLTGTPDVLGTHNNIRVRATNAAGSADSNLFSSIITEMQAIFSRDYTGVDIGADAVFARASNASLETSDGVLMTLPNNAARLRKSRTVFNLFGDVANWATPVVSSETLSVGWSVASGATIDPDNVTFNLAADELSRILTTNYTGYSLDYLRGRTYYAVVNLSCPTTENIRLRLNQSGSNIDTYQSIVVTSTPKYFVVGAFIDPLTTGLSLSIQNEAGASTAVIGLLYNEAMLEDITGRKQNITDITGTNDPDNWDLVFGNNTKAPDPEGGTAITYVNNEAGAQMLLTVADGTMQSEIPQGIEQVFEFYGKMNTGACKVSVVTDTGQNPPERLDVEITATTYTRYIGYFTRPVTAEVPYLRFQELSAGEVVSIKDVRIYEEVAPSEYVSFGVEAGPLYHGLGADAVKAFPFDLVSSFNRFTGEVTYGTGTTPVVAEGLLMEPAAVNNVPNSRFDVPGAGGADVFAYWNETINGDSTVNLETVDLPPGGYTSACRLDVDSAASNVFITASPPIYLTVVDQVDNIFLSMWTKQTLTTNKIVVRIVCDDGVGGSVQYLAGTGWSDTISNIVISAGDAWAKQRLDVPPTNAGRTRVWLDSVRRLAGSNDHSLYFTDIQLEKIAPTSRIRTEGTAVARAVDSLEYPLTTPQAEGVVLMRMRFGIDYTYAPGGNKGILSFSAVSANQMPIYDNVTQGRLGANDGTSFTFVDLNFLKDKEYYIATRWSGAEKQIGYRNITDSGVWVWSSVGGYDGDWTTSNIVNLFFNLAYPNTVALTEVYDVDPGTDFIEGKY